MKKITFILFLIFSVTQLFAQKFTASASKARVAVGEQFQISFTLNTNGSNFTPPLLNDFDVYSGPNQSTSMQFINGNMSQSLSLSYILAAKKEGQFVIASASINTSAGKLQSNPITIEVVKGSANSQPQAQSQGRGQGTGQSEETSGDNLFVRTSVNKSRVYQGEQVTVTHKVYTRLNLVGFKDIKFPSYNSFWSQELPQQSQINLTQENIDGVSYNVAELKKVFLFPQRSGTLQVEPLEVECVVRQRSNRRPQSIFDQFFGNGGYEDVAYSAKSKPVKIEVMPLPENNKPKDFSGAVGSYTFKAEINKNKVKANDGINLTIGISGKGNLKLIDPLKIDFPEDIETYDPKVSDNISANATGVSGSKTFDYLIIPRHPGEYKIDKIAFSYFDPEKKNYITLPSPEFNITVEKGDEKDGGATMVTSVNKEDVKLLGSDIRYIKTNNIQLIKKGDYFFGSIGFIGGLVTPVLLFLSFLVARKRYIEQNSDVVLVKSRKATKMAKKRLAIAEKHLKSDSKAEFYDEVLRALNDYLSNKLNIPVADLSKDAISLSLQKKKVSEETIGLLVKTINNCEYARYAPTAVSGGMENTYSDTVKLITNIEDEL